MCLVLIHGVTEAKSGTVNTVVTVPCRTPPSTDYLSECLGYKIAKVYVPGGPCTLYRRFRACMHARTRQQGMHARTRHTRQASSLLVCDNCDCDKHRVAQHRHVGASLARRTYTGRACCTVGAEPNINSVCYCHVHVHDCTGLV